MDFKIYQGNGRLLAERRQNNRFLPCYYGINKIYQDGALVGSVVFLCEKKEILSVCRNITR